MEVMVVVVVMAAETKMVACNSNMVLSVGDIAIPGSI